MLPIITIKVARETRLILRKISKETQRKHYEIVHTALKNELNRVKKETV